MRGTPRTVDLLAITPENYPDRVPDFTSEAEEQEFWATHSSSPYQGQGELVFDGRAEFRSEGSVSDSRLLIAVSDTTMAGLEARAGQDGQSVQELVREWIEDRLHTETMIFGEPRREATA